MFLSDPHRTGTKSAQVIDLLRVVPLFRMWRSSGDVRPENYAHLPGCRESVCCSFYPLKRNKRNSGTRPWEQGLSPFQTVPSCSALAAPPGRGGRQL